jgi:hypothetical protein
VNEHYNLEKLKEGIKVDNANSVWNKIFKLDPLLGRLGILYHWKSKYLFPYGDVAPLRDFEEDPVSKKPSKYATSQGQSDQSIQNIESMLPVELQNSLENQPVKTFETLINNKYRLCIEDLGGEVLGAHLLDELSRPINITQDQISKDLHRISNAFPTEFIPCMTDAEILIESLQKKIKKLDLKKKSQMQTIKQMEVEESKQRQKDQARDSLVDEQFAQLKLRRNNLSFLTRADQLLVSQLTEEASDIMKARKELIQLEVS